MNKPASRMNLRRAGQLALALLVLAVMLSLPAAASAQSAGPSAVTCPTSVVVAAGDSLSSISGRTLGDPTAYARIVAATNAAATADSSFATITNPNVLVVGWKLCLPTGASALAPATATPRPAATRAVSPAATATPAASNLEPGIAVSETVEIDVEELTIAWLARQETPGSEIVIEETLAAGSNYDRYLTSYQSEGLKIYAYMTVPRGVTPATGWPVVVFNHGYIPPEIYRSTERYIAYADAFARNGYIVFRPDYRGHAFSEGDARGAYSSPDYVLDVLNALASVKQWPVADPERIGMWGHSMGGYITLRAMVVRDDIKAGVIWAGVIASYPDMLTNWRRNQNTVPSTIPQNARRWRTVLVEEFGAPEENPERWAEISANSYLDELSGPVQLHHGTADTSVPVEFSRTLEQQIVAAGGVVEYFEYPGDDHNIAGYFTPAINESVAFFDEHVKNAE